MLNNKDFTKIHKEYTKYLNSLNKANLKDINFPLDYFITYLKLMRDYYILNEPLILDSGEENLKIASLATAVSEYEKYKNCIHSYYTSNGTRKIEGSAEEVLQKYNAEKNFHWQSF
jgi:hypothetical protein